MIAAEEQMTNRAAAEQAYVRASAEAMAKDEKSASFEDLSAIGVTLINEFNQAENDRRLTEQRWLMDLRQFRGQYDPDVLAKIGPNRSKAFIRKTRVKVNTVDARIIDLLFPSNNERNFGVDPTPKPTLVPEQVAQIGQALAQALQRQPTPQEMEKAAIEVSRQAAKAMEQTIDDQLVEASYKNTVKKVVHSGNLYGTGILKAPLVERKIRTRFVNEGGKWVMKTETYTVPFVDFVPLWRFYPDMTATSIEDCRYTYERHLMTKQAMLKLAERKSFNAQRIRDYVTSNPDGQVRYRYYDTELRIIGERQATQLNKSQQYEVLERWGWLDAAQLLACGVKVPKERLHETFFSNVWLLPNGEVIRAVIQPINGVTWPYHFYYFDKDETSIFGEGLASVMRDDQTMLNAACRMILDNAALTSGPQLEVNMSLLAKGEKANEILPFKIWPRSGIGEDARSPAIRVLDIPNHIQDLSGIMAMFENNADEVTAIPRYMYGDNPGQGAAGTASGLSMLMGSASIVMKALVVAFDEGITKPFITALYRWNMQFNPNPAIKGDFDVKPCAVTTLVAKEVRAQQLDQFAAQTANPLDAPYIKRDAMLRQRAEAHDLADCVKTEDEVLEEQNNPANQAQAQLAQAQAQLALQQMQATVAKLEAEVVKMQADALRAQADAMSKRVGAAYSAMQAGGVAVSNAHIAPAADEILRSAGWTDATPQEEISQAVVPGGPATQMPQGGPGAGMQQGMDAGIETPAIGDGNA